MSEVDQQSAKGKINVETVSDRVRMDEETKREKEPELGEVEQGIKDETQEERMGQDGSIATEGGKEELLTKVSLKDEEKVLQERDVESKVLREQGEKLEKSERSPEKCEQVEVGKKDIPEKKDKTENTEEKENHNDREEKKEDEKKMKDGPEEEEKTEEKKEKEEKKGKEVGKEKEKKEKKSKSSSERIQKKLEKINAKISRIFAKKEEYESRLKEAQNRERQESEKAERREAFMDTGKSAKDNYSPGSKTEGNIETDQLRRADDTSALEPKNKLAERGLSGSLSRTTTIIEVTSAELMEEVARQKKGAEEFAKREESDGLEVNTGLAMDASEVVRQDERKF